jgi:hypothetical protein
MHAWSFTASWVEAAAPIHRASASVLENSVFQVANAAMLWDQMTNPFMVVIGFLLIPDSEIAALQGGFFVSSAGRRITPGCDNSPPTTTWAPPATSRSNPPTENLGRSGGYTQFLRAVFAC